MTEGGAVLAGLIGGVIVVFSIELLRKLKLTMLLVQLLHGVAGFWGTVVIGLWGVNGVKLSDCSTEVVCTICCTISWCTVVYGMGSSIIFIVFGILKATIGLQ